MANIPGDRRIATLADLATIDAAVGERVWVEAENRFVEAVPAYFGGEQAGPSDSELTPIAWRRSAGSFGPFTSIAEFRAATPPSVDTECFIEGAGYGIYKPGSGANLRDDGLYVIRPTAVLPTENGAFFLRANAVGSMSARDRLVDTVLSVAPTIIGDIWLEDGLPSAGTVATWQSALGIPTPLAATTAARHEVRYDPEIGRKYIASADTTLKGLSVAAGVTKTIYLLAKPAASAAGQIYVFINGTFPLYIGPTATKFANDSGAPVLQRSGVDGAAALISTPAVFSAKISANNAAGFTFDGQAGYPVKGNVYGIIQLLGVPSAAQDATIVAACNTYLGGARQPDLFLVVGNSIAAGASTNTNLFSQQYPASACRVPNMISYNKAQSGRNWAQVLSNLPTDLASIDERGFRRKIAFMYEDVNTLSVTATLEDVVDGAWDLAAALRAAGYLVIGATCMPASSIPAGTNEGIRVSANAIRRTEWASHFDALIDFPDDLPKYDGTHLTAAGYGVFAGIVRRNLVSLLATLG